MANPAHVCRREDLRVIRAQIRCSPPTPKPPSPPKPETRSQSQTGRMEEIVSPRSPKEARGRLRAQVHGRSDPRGPPSAQPLTDIAWPGWHPNKPPFIISHTRTELARRTAVSSRKRGHSRQSCARWYKSIAENGAVFPSTCPCKVPSVDSRHRFTSNGAAEV